MNEFFLFHHYKRSQLSICSAISSLAAFKAGKSSSDFGYILAQCAVPANKTTVLLITKNLLHTTIYINRRSSLVGSFCNPQCVPGIDGTVNENNIGSFNV